MTDRNGPVNFASVALFLYRYQEDYSATARTDSQGRFDMLVTRMPGDGELRTSHGSHAKDVKKFTCAPPPTNPDAFLCGSQASLSFNVLLAKVVGITLMEPSLLHVGDSAPIQREVRLDDGRVILDDSSNPAMFETGGVNNTWTFDPAVAKVMTGPDSKSHVFGLAVGNATLTSVIGGVKATLAIRVDPKPPTLP